MLHLHLLKGYGVLHLLWGYRQREIILSFQNIPSILITPKILSILNFLNFLNFPITPIIPINPINPIIHQKTLTEKICKGFDIIILTFSVSSPSPKK
jgi:hypothetical protein